MVQARATCRCLHRIEHVLLLLLRSFKRDEQRHTIAHHTFTPKKVEFRQGNPLDFKAARFFRSDFWNPASLTGMAGPGASRLQNGLVVAFWSNSEDADAAELNSHHFHSFIFLPNRFPIPNRSWTGSNGWVPLVVPRIKFDQMPQLLKLRKGEFQMLGNDGFYTPGEMGRRGSLVVTGSSLQMFIYEVSGCELRDRFRGLVAWTMKQ